LTVAEGLDAYKKALVADYQDRYLRGFDMLASREAGTRIGGLYVLEGLVKDRDIESAAADAIESFTIQRYTILQSIAAFAVGHSLMTRTGKDDPVVAEDALVALRVLGEINVNIPKLPWIFEAATSLGALSPVQS
jgi:hypothetical protein